jgi:hypothetical protein
MQVTNKVGHVVFVHDDQFKGDVEIRRGEASLTVPIEALRTLVAESVRHQLAEHVQKMKPTDLLRRIA